MKKIILLLALFPFLHKSAYPVTYVSCKVDEIIVQHEDETMEVTLFNTKITKEKGWDTACSMIKNAKKLRIEVDPSTKVEDPLSVYLFADDVLVQEELIKKSYAYPMIKNPEYTYEKRLEKAIATTSVMAKPATSTEKKGYPMVAPIVLGVALLLWSIMLWYMIYKKRKKLRQIREKQ